MSTLTTHSSSNGTVSRQGKLAAALAASKRHLSGQLAAFVAQLEQAEAEIAAMVDDTLAEAVAIAGRIHQKTDDAKTKLTGITTQAASRVDDFAAALASDIQAGNPDAPVEVPSTPEMPLMPPDEPTTIGEPHTPYEDDDAARMADEIAQQPRIRHEDIDAVVMPAKEELVARAEAEPTWTAEAAKEEAEMLTKAWNGLPETTDPDATVPTDEPVATFDDTDEALIEKAVRILSRDPDRLNKHLKKSVRKLTDAHCDEARRRIANAEWNNV